MKKICECYVNCANEDGTLFYGGFYHVSLKGSADLLEKGFPLPAIQLEISASIPWVLDKENSYPK